MFAFYHTILKSITFILVVQCLIENCSLGATNCHLIKAECSGWSSYPSKCFWSKGQMIDSSPSKEEIIPLLVEFGNKR